MSCENIEIIMIIIGCCIVLLQALSAVMSNVRKRAESRARIERMNHSNHLSGSTTPTVVPLGRSSRDPPPVVSHPVMGDPFALHEAEDDGTPVEASSGGSTQIGLGVGDIAGLVMGEVPIVDAIA